jgi:hypothetical protein
MIKKITRAYTRHYRDNKQVTSYVEWVNKLGDRGRTYGDPNNSYMRALLVRARKQGVTIEREVW